MKKRKMYSATALTATTAVLVGVTGVSAEQTLFNDVPASHPYGEAISALAALGVVNGFGDGTFKPDAAVTRGQAAKMIAGAFQLTTENVDKLKFKDVEQTSPYFGAIVALTSLGVINGYEDGTFRPGANLTHGHIKLVIERVSTTYPIDTEVLFELASVTYDEKKNITRGELASILTTALKIVEEDSKYYKLSVMHVNDTHGRVDVFPKLMTAVKEQRTKNPDALLLHGGDAFSGTLYFNEFEGQADIPFLNAMKFDAMVFGNHEFDLGSSPEGHKALADFVKAANFPFISANTDFSKDTLFTGLFSDLVSSEPENGKIYAGMVKEINGEKVGIFGLTTAETKDIASPGSIAFENYIEEANKAVKAFEDKGVNKIIALTHIGFDDNVAYDNDQMLAKSVPGIDIIVGGHTHTQLDKPVVVDTNTVGEKKDATLIVQAYQYSDYLGTLNVAFDENGVVVKHKGQLIKVGDLAEDPAGVKLLAPYKEKVDATQNAEIGVTLTQALANPRSSETSTVSVRNSETALGNIITDGMLAKAKKSTAKKVVMALQNGGGIRVAIDEGPITTGEVITVLPFGNTLALADVTGAELRATFEHAVKDTPKESGGFLHISGAKFEYDSTKEVGSRVVSLKYFDESTNSYVDIQDNQTYTIATNAFTAKGGDGFADLKKAYAAGRVTDLGLSDWENLKEQFLSLKEIPYELQGRIVDVAATK
ncbi:5'-nucleotidase C-terminal domain-containing protein [Solibacillus sp. MA9]|uniref:5'-nucleotidase C-terminal domain-containing protein n=1 Tax=Solibacillus palustris TaxID=2908203 RepID=A0ABS9UCJ4_9BACL|nr:5'-nucleotidase C-terminal domain-containing protein [Solibacillus sp. MA9]MCH7322061.1 5'-nucleotidase C-terminal domain-containing protein [Solibacillus sp. MA9]